MASWKKNKMTDPRLATLADTTKQQIFKLRKGERNLTVQWAKRLAPHLDVTWQVLIDESPPSTDPIRVDLLAAYDSMTDEQRQALLTVAKILVPADKPREEPAQPPKRQSA
ncbi:MAG TPA: hypothetical protein VGM42_17680 [Rhodopila sp.]